MSDGIFVKEYFFGSDLWSFIGCTFAISWLILIFYIIYKIFIEKMWFEKYANCHTIIVSQDNRIQRFEEVKERVHGMDEDLRNDILRLSFFELRDSLSYGKYSAQQVLYAYAWRALEVHDKFNCISEFITESFNQASFLDKSYQISGEKLPLFGIPFSVKGNFYLKGYDCCIGLAQRLNNPMTKECTFVTHLKSLGAIPFVVTNVPQTLLSYVCSNPVYGETKNPFDIKRTPGGSSGGEACLLAAGGTPFAIGSDLVGSLRIPASFCGLYTLKPTQDRYLVENAVGGVPGRSRLGLGYGFFTKSIEEQNYLLDLIFGTDAYKSLISRYAASLPFKERMYEDTLLNKRLRIGYFVDNGFLKVVPGCARVVNDTVEMLRNEGYDLVKFNVPKPKEAASALFKAIFPDGGSYFSNLFKHDIVDKNMKEFAFLLKMPKFLRSLFGIAVKPFSPQTEIMARAYVKSAIDVRKTNEEVDAYIKEFTDLWNELKIDALVCPAFTVPPIPHSYPSKLGACAFSTGLFNMLDYPAGVVPAGKVRKQDDLDLIDETKWPTYRNFLLRLIRSAASNSEKLPLSVQVVALPFEEEKCLAVMKIVDNFWRNVTY